MVRATDGTSSSATPSLKSFDRYRFLSPCGNGSQHSVALRDGAVLVLEPTRHDDASPLRVRARSRRPWFHAAKWRAHCRRFAPPTAHTAAARLRDSVSVAWRVSPLLKKNES